LSESDIVVKQRIAQDALKLNEDFSLNVGMENENRETKRTRIPGFHEKPSKPIN
jgi:hypothetical protein